MYDDDDVEVIRVPTESEIKTDLQDRTTFIGASDAPVILGLSPWKSPYRLYQEKRGEVPPDDLSEVERVQWGILMEDVVAREYARRHGFKVRRVNQRVVYKERTYIVAQIDRMIVGGGILEIKTSSMLGAWDTLPVYYWVQVQQQMLCTGRDHTTVAALIAGNYMKEFDVPADKSFHSDLIMAIDEFWERVKIGNPPAPITTDEAVELWSKAPSQEVVGTETDGVSAARLMEVKEQISSLEAEADALKLNLQAAMQNLGDTLVVNGIPIVSWKNQTRKSLDQEKVKNEYPEIAEQCQKITESRVFRILKGASNFKGGNE